MSGFDQDPESARHSAIRKTSGFAFALALIIFVLGLNGRQPMSEARAPVEDVSSKIVGVLSMPVRGFENLVSDAGNYFNTAAENKRLKAELVHLRQIENEDLALREQVEYLEALLNTDITAGIGNNSISARAVSETDGPFARSALLNAGQTNGIEKGQAVLTANGLYGRIVRTGRMSSRALLLNDLSSRIAVMSLRSRSRAILSGKNSNMPTLDFRGDSDWAVGDKVVTSGDDGVLPRGLSVGEVVAIRPGVLGVKLLTDNAPIDWVWVLPYVPIKPPEDDLALAQTPSPDEDGASASDKAPVVSDENAALQDAPQELSEDEGP